MGISFIQSHIRKYTHGIDIHLPQHTRAHEHMHIPTNIHIYTCALASHTHELVHAHTYTELIRYDTQTEVKTKQDNHSPRSGSDILESICSFFLRETAP